MSRESAVDSPQTDDWNARTGNPLPASWWRVRPQTVPASFGQTRGRCTLAPVSLARGLERRLERLFDGFAARLFRGAVHPVELGNRLEREADLAVYETEVGPAVPNLYRVQVGGELPEADALRELQAELASVLEETATERGWRLEGPVTVALRHNANLSKGTVDVSAEVHPGGRTPWAVLEPSDELGTPLEVQRNRSLFGRSVDVDCHLSDDSVSRRHALLWQEAGSTWVTDLGSSNGTFVNGTRIAGATEVEDGSVLAFGTDTYVLRLS